MAKKKTKSSTKKKVPAKPKGRKILLSKQELMYFIYYIIAGLVLALILLAAKVPFLITLSKFYGFIWMFFVPGLFIFRAWFKHKTFNTQWEEYGWPILISWVLHSIIIACISGFFKTPITNLNLFGTSLVLLIIAVIVFYSRK